MSTKYATNYPIPSSSTTFGTLWKLTRTMKAAGWTYKASSNGLLKDTSANATNDLWGGNSDPTTDTYSSPLATYITSAFTLTSSTTSVAVNSTTGFPGSGTIYFTDGYSGGTPNGTVTATYTGTSGGNTFTGITATGSTFIPAGTSVGSSAMTLDYPNPAWWVGSGPQTIKIQLNAAPTGTPLRGENVTQTGSGATAEYLGHVWDTFSLSGWIALVPRTGTFDCVNTITGGVSSATFTPLTNGTLSIFNREIMFYKDYSTTLSTATTTGTIYYICAEAFDGYGAYTNPTLSTTVSVLSNGNNITNSTLNVASTTNFPPVGTVLVNDGYGIHAISYTGISGNSFTGCTTGPETEVGGTVSTGSAVTVGGIESGQLFSNLATQSISTTINGGTLTVSGSNFTLTVLSTSGFPSSGNITVLTNNYGYVVLSYTATTSTTFTTCNLVIGNSTGTLISGVSTVTSGCTSYVGPGMGGFNNSFPAQGIVVRGTASSLTGASFFGLAASFQTNAQIACVNAVPSSNTSADGSFYIALSNSATANTACGFAFMRVDDTEPGDCDPYVFMIPYPGVNVSSWSGSSTQSTNGYTFNLANIRNASTMFLGYQAKGNSGVYNGNMSVNNPCSYTTCPMYDVNNSQNWGIMTVGGNNAARIKNNPNATYDNHPAVLDVLPIYGYLPGNNAVQLKGRLRWMFVGAVYTLGSSSYATTYDTMNSKSLLVLSVGSNNNPNIIIAPFDGSTTPVQ